MNKKSETFTGIFRKTQIDISSILQGTKKKNPPVCSKRNVKSYRFHKLICIVRLTLFLRTAGRLIRKSPVTIIIKNISFFTHQTIVMDNHLTKIAQEVNWGGGGDLY